MRTYFSTLCPEQTCTFAHRIFKPTSKKAFEWQSQRAKELLKLQKAKEGSK